MNSRRKFFAAIAGLFAIPKPDLDTTLIRKMFYGSTQVGEQRLPATTTLALQQEALSRYYSQLLRQNKNRNYYEHLQ